jgi:hypothetical protein
MDAVSPQRKCRPRNGLEQHTTSADPEAVDRDVAALTFAMRRLDSPRGFF